MVNLGRPLARHAANRSSEVLAQHQDARSTSFSSATLPAPTCHDRVARAKETPKIDERGGKIVHNFVRNNSERTIEFDLNSFHLSVSHTPFKRCFVKLLSRFILFIRILRAYPLNSPRSYARFEFVGAREISAISRNEQVVHRTHSWLTAIETPRIPLRPFR